jgi:type I restriction enzyme, R subunit
VDKAIAPDGIMSLFEIAGLPQPNISLLSPELLLEVQALP